MADVVTETNVVQVTLLDSEGYVRTVNLDNPKSTLTLNEIKAAFKTAIDGQWLYGRGGFVVDVQKANYSTATKIPIAGAEVVVTPSSLDMTSNSGSVVVTGAVVSAAYISNMNYDAPSDWEVGWQMPVIDTDTGTITIKLLRVNGSGSASVTGTATLNIYFSGGNISIPVSFRVENL